MKFRVAIARLVREVATVIVEAPSRDELEDRLGEVYDEVDDEDLEWETDPDYLEEGTHYIVEALPESNGTPPNHVLSE